MAELRRVVPPDRKPDRWLPASIAAVTILTLIAIAKPWGGPAVPLAVLPSVTPPPVHATRPPGRGQYDPALFGRDAPEPGWQLWPAGYVVDFGLAGPVPIESGGPGGDARMSPTPKPSPPSSPTGRPSGSPPPYGTAVPIRIGQADNLVVLGINTPLDVDVVRIRLVRYEGRRTVTVPVVTLPTPWPVGHFHVIGMESPDGTDLLGAWQPGFYRLDLLIADGSVVRSVVVQIDPPSPTLSGPTPTPIATD
jgi:hypothetical protein